MAAQVGHRPLPGQHKHGHGPVSEAKRNAEALFESKTVSEIREIESRTRKDIEGKKLQLRQLVGDSYRDLIESADKIVAISTNCHNILDNIKNIQSGFSALAHSFTFADNLLNEKRDSLSKHEQLHAIGGRVKYLVDTPEMIWGCLDSRQYLEAARRFLRAQQVYSLLNSTFSKELLGKFPLLTHQWPLVQKFKKQVVDTVHSSLSSEAYLSTDQTADLLAAVSALQGLDSAGALQLLLSSRKAWISQQLAAYADPANGSDTQAVAMLLSTLAQTTQTTVSQVGELFLASNRASDCSCLLQATIREDELDSSELFFAGFGTQGGVQQVVGGTPGGSSSEAEAWRKANKGIYEKLVALSPGQVEKVCGQWLKEVAEEFGRQCAVLLQSCASASSLVEVEAGVKAAIAGWQHPSIRASGKSGMAAKRQKSAGGAGVPAPSEPQLESWSSVCEWVLGSSLGLWQEVFHMPFVARAKQLIEASFQQVGAALELPLEECLAAAAQASPEDAGMVCSRRWPLAPAEAIDLASSLAEGGPGANGSQGAKPLLHHVASGTGPMARTWSEKLASNWNPRVVQDDKGFRQRIKLIRQQFDEELRKALQAVLLLVAGAADPTGGDSRGPAAAFGSAQRLLGVGTMPPMPCTRRDAAGRAAELEPFVQLKCGEMATAVATKLQARLDGLGAPAEGASGSAVAEQILLVARLCSSVASDSRFLQVILGSPDGWRPAVGSSHMARIQALRSVGNLGAASKPGTSRMQQVMDKFRAAAMAGYRAWAKWSTASLAAALREALLGDEMLVAATTPLSWQETVITSPASDNALADPVQDMRFSLPACPSSSILLYLSAACQEIRRAGDHTTVTEALQIFEWELAGAGLQCYSQLLQAGSPLEARVSEKGVLQLLLDVRFLRDVLAGGRPMLPGSSSLPGSADPLKPSGSMPGLLELQDPSVMVAMSERKREGLALEQLLQERLDPIDWATYEPYLWANVQRYYQRVAILLGCLVQLQRAHPETARAQVMQDTNPMNVLPVAPRFQYLPISQPASLGGHAKAKVSLAGLTKAAAGTSSSDLAGNYSFADLGASRLSQSANSQQQGQAAAAAAAAGRADAGTSALAGLQARLQGSALGSLGSMFGDKAAEMTAMAQQRFDAFGDISALGTGLLSSFAKNVVKK